LLKVRILLPGDHREPDIPGAFLVARLQIVNAFLGLFGCHFLGFSIGGTKCLCLETMETRLLDSERYRGRERDLRRIGDVTINRNIP
jgi:hypothetical protein